MKKKVVKKASAVKRLTPFMRVVAKVRKHDKKAAAWLIKNEKKLVWLDKNSCDLVDSFSWVDTEQGGEFWNNLDDKITAKKGEIRIRDYVVEFTKTGITVGCTTVDKATILAIAKRFKK